ncbi:hypothetical protein M3Y97_00537400 [Aphelenchoides bicaudatus]|nr:hypothetical protein M3Y97_00537400 [Aphelenchoides bicaudatus]
MAPSLNLDDSLVAIEPQKVSISVEDQKLIDKIKEQLAEELKLVPGYETNSSLMRWLIGWNRKIDQIIPRLRVALLDIYAMRIPEQDFSSVEKIVEYCDSISEAANYLPGTLIGRDKCGNVVSLQVLGNLDGHGLMKAVRISDLYISRIAESEGVMNLSETGEQIGTTLIIDLEGLCRDGVTLASIKVISIMLHQLQEMFPDVVRKILIVNAPTWISAIFSLISVVLAKQTKQKIEFLGTDWKEQLQKYVDKQILYEHWGGTRKASTACGNVKMGGIIPEKLYYNESTDHVDLTDLKVVNVPARGSTFIELEVTDEHKTIGWWWQNKHGDLDFHAMKCTDDGQETLVWPKFRLLTSFVPEYREIQHRGPGIYRLYFGNTHGKVFSKDVQYKFWVN